jgi:signal transduction histidine kinase
MAADLSTMAGGVPLGRGRLASVRSRTTLAAGLVMAVALLGGGMALHTLLRATLVRSVDKVAEARAEDLAALAAGGGLPDPVGVEDDAFVQVVDDAYRVVASSENFRGQPAFDYSLASTIGGPSPLVGEFRLVAVRGTSDAGPITIYVGATLEPVNETMSVLETSLLVGSPLLVALVAVLTWTTVGRALGPVEAIRARVAEVSTRDLSRRVPEPDADDEIGRLAGTMNAMLGRLESAVERQRRFVADASHELQSPLAAVRTDLEVALAHPEAAEWPDVARDLLDENRRMERLVADLLFVARADGSAPRVPPAPVDLHDVVLEEAARALGSGRVIVDTWAVTAVVVAGRRDDLARAVRNLLDNALRHAVAQVTVGLRATEDTVTLVVEDDGPGVAPADRERIFERFTRLDFARSRAADGTGLGLAIVREIVDAHGGRVFVEDGAVGARLVVTLPAD